MTRGLVQPAGEFAPPLSRARQHRRDNAAIIATIRHWPQPAALKGIAQ